MPGIHVLGDAIQVAPLMPKSGHMANQHGKVAAAAVLAALPGEPMNPSPVLNNACYSFINDREAVHVASVHRYDAAQKTFATVPGSGGLSAGKSVRKATTASPGRGDLEPTCSASAAVTIVGPPSRSGTRAHVSHR